MRAAVNPPPPSGWIRPVLIGWAAIAAIMVVRAWPLFAGMHFSDPDDALRMVQVRDLTAGQGWFDLHQYRIAPPQGVAMHWSRLVDAPLAAVILLLRPLIGQGAAELSAAILVPLLTLLAVMLCMGRLIARKFGADLVLVGSLLMLLMIPAATQLVPLRIDHHGWQIFAVAAALNALIARSPLHAAPIAGLALAFGMSVSLELLPFAALLGGIFALRWWQDRAEWRWLAWYLDALVLGSAGFFLATRGGDFANHCDTISPAYLAGLGVIALGVHAAAVRATLSRTALTLALGAAALLGVAIFLALAPACTAGPFARLDPLVQSFWYDNVREGMPVWRQDWAALLTMTVPPLGALASALVLARHSGDRFWRDYALVLAGGMAIALLVSRFAAVTTAISVLPLAWLVRTAAQRLPGHGGYARKGLMVAALAALLLPGALLDLLGKLPAAGAGIAGKPAAGAPSPATASADRMCSQPGSLAALAALPPGTMLTPLDLGPFVLLGTPHRVLATGHHRGAAAMHDSLSAYMAVPGAAEALLRARRIDYVLVCGDAVENRMEQDRAPQGLAAQLLAGQDPAWLEPVDLGPGGGLMKVWRLRR